MMLLRKVILLDNHSLVCMYVCGGVFRRSSCLCTELQGWLVDDSPATRKIGCRLEECQASTILCARIAIYDRVTVTRNVVLYVNFILTKTKKSLWAFPGKPTRRSDQKKVMCEETKVRIWEGDLLAQVEIIVFEVNSPSGTESRNVMPEDGATSSLCCLRVRRVFDQRGSAWMKEKDALLGHVDSNVPEFLTFHIRRQGLDPENRLPHLLFRPY